MSKSRPQERHLFPADDGSYLHSASPWCKCRPFKRGRKHGHTYVHNAMSRRVADGRKENASTDQLRPT